MNALITTAYVVGIALFLSRAENIFGGHDKETILISIIMLTIFIVSATITGFAVFGRPIMWYTDGKKKEAVALLGATVGCLIIIAGIFIIMLFLK